MIRMLYIYPFYVLHYINNYLYDSCVSSFAIVSEV